MNLQSYDICYGTNDNFFCNYADFLNFEFVFVKDIKAQDGSLNKKKGIVINKLWASSIAVRMLAYCAEDPRFGTNFEPRVGRLLTVYPGVNGNQLETLEI